jgi:beta-galactosidase
MKIFKALSVIIYSLTFTGNILAQPAEKVNSNSNLLPGSLKVNQSLPQLGAEVWLEPQFTASYIESLFKLMADNHMQAARIFIGSGNPEMYDNAFASAEKYGVKIQATLSVPERPNSEDDLVSSAQNIKRIVSRYKNSPALETWWLMNEPGNGPSSSPFAMKLFRDWLGIKYGDIKSFNSKWRRNYTSFKEVQYNEAWASASNLSSTVEYLDWFQFSAYRLTWILQWIANEVSKEDNLHQFHTNPAGIFNNLSQYEFPVWRSFLTSLGASIHPAWHFTLLKPDQFAMGIAATCDIIKGGSEPNPFWVSELQSGNNVWSGNRPLGPEAEDIAQWTWTSIGCGAEKVIYWLLNNRSRGGESGEWSMLDFQGKPRDRLETASQIAQVINKEKDFFSGARPLERKVVILLSPESMLILARKAAKDGLAGRSANAHILSALSYYQTLSELGIPAIFKYTDDFEWENKMGCVAIFPNAVAVPEKVVRRAEKFVANGNKLIIDGLTGYFDENEVNVLQTGFFFEKLCGATIKDIRTKEDLFLTHIDNVSELMVAHLWQTEILNHTAVMVGNEGERITAVRNKYGKGEVLWIPMALGLGAWLGKNGPLSELLANEIGSIRTETPITFKQKTNNVIMQILQNGNSYVSVITNGTDEVKEVSLQLNKKLNPQIIFNSTGKEIQFNPLKITLSGSQTIVVKWTALR